MSLIVQGVCMFKIIFRRFSVDETPKFPQNFFDCCCCDCW